ncbi:hypothetical protein EV356DRAFT_501872 [Viridothelium virens]|uniref:Uncharacterized protein n=1 Tax=Viridothelium virens TaxID=1048519 RepID=A0A6A6H9Z6_VIRVR|nr:hypothetical protein EV356DRAFT_501872 [Viridothelium virens]
MERVGDHFEKLVQLPKISDKIYYKVRLSLGTLHGPHCASPTIRNLRLSVLAPTGAAVF